MGKFEDIINENRVNQLQEVLVDFFGQTVPQQRLVQLTKNSRGFVQAAVSVDSDYSFDKTARKFRPDQVGQKANNIGNNRVMTNRITPAKQTTQKPVTEAATADSVQKFAQWVGMKPLDPQTAENAAKRWPEFIEAIKNKLQWNYGIERSEQPAPEQPAPEQPAPEQPAPEQENEPPVNPVGKSLFRRGIEAAGRGLKGLGSAVAGAVSQQDPYNPNANRNPFGDLGISKMKLGQNPGKIDSKEIDERLGHIEAKMTTLPGEDQLKLKDIHDKLLDNWIKVKPALVSYPEKNQEWKNYIQNQLTELEKGVGIQPGSATSGANVYSQPVQSTKQEPQSSSVRA